MLKIRNVLIQKRHSSLFFWRKKPENTEENTAESPIFQEIAEEQKLKEDEIKIKQNKSRLSPVHRNILFNEMPYKTPLIDYHKSLSYQRKMFGKYGDKSNLTPAICWPTEDELKAKIEYETVAYPYKVSEVLERHKIKMHEEKEARAAHKQMIIEKYSRLEQWKKELIQKIAKKEAEALAAKITKDKLIEEIRTHFGYKIDVHDEKFVQMLEQKQKDLRKKRKMERKKAHELKLLQLIQNEKEQMAQNEEEDSNEDDNDEKNNSVNN